ILLEHLCLAKNFMTEVRRRRSIPARIPRSTRISIEGEQSPGRPNQFNTRSIINFWVEPRAVETLGGENEARHLGATIQKQIDYKRLDIRHGPLQRCPTQLILSINLHKLTIVVADL
ncbi:unnamed protein product, partial [Trichogramma brassicae]